MSPTFNVSDLKKYYPLEEKDTQLRAIVMKERSSDAEHLLNSVIKDTSESVISSGLENNANQLVQRPTRIINSNYGPKVVNKVQIKPKLGSGHCASSLKLMSLPTTLWV